MSKKIQIGDKPIKLQPAKIRLTTNISVSATLPKKDYLRERLQRAAKSPRS